jgi:tetratricopeptide (TPR) repeat protein
MDPVTFKFGLDIAKTAVPIAGGQLKKLWRRDELRNLMAAVKRRVKDDVTLDRGQRRAAEAQLKPLRNDPELGGLLQLLLDGDVDALPAIRERSSVLLRFSDDDDVHERVVDAFMAAVDASVVAAKRDNRSALVASTQLARGTAVQQGDRIERAIERRAKEQQAEAAESHRRLDERLANLGGPVSQRATLLALTGGPVDEETRETLRELDAHDRAAASAVAGRLAEGGAADVAAWVGAEPVELLHADAQTWHLIGRLLLEQGEFAAAETAYETAARGTKADVARHLVAAATAARIAGAPDRDAGGDRHPSVVLVDLRRFDGNPAKALATLDAVTPRTDQEAAAFDITRAQIHLSERDIDAARKAYDRAQAVRPRDFGVREVGALLILMEQEQQGIAEDKVDHAAVLAASDALLEIRNEMLAVGRIDEASQMLSRAMEARVLGGRSGEALELLRDAADAERRAAGRTFIARAALWAGSPEVALELLPGDDSDDEIRLVRAEAIVQSGEGEDVTAGVHDLDELVERADERLRLAAAFSRLVASARHIEVPWSESAEALLRADNATIADIVHADALVLRGEHEEAERLLRRHPGDHRALQGLVEVSMSRRDWDEAIDRSTALRQLHDIPEVRLQHASLLRHAGEHAVALELFSAGARDTAPDTHTRTRAYRGAIELAQDLRRFPLMESLAGEAISLAPDATELHWARAFARFRQSRNAKALADIDAAGIAAENLAQAELLSRILYRSDDVGAAIARVVELSDRFDRPETLEIAIIITAQRQPDRSPLPDDVVDRIRATYADFPQRFPESTFLRAYEVPDDPAAMRQWLDEVTPDAPDGAAQVGLDVIYGTTLSAALAAAHDLPLSAVWASWDFLPLGYSEHELDELELQDARDAVGHTVVVDPTAVAVLARLPAALADRAVESMLLPRIADAALQDVDAAAAPARDPRRSVARIGRDPATGEPVIHETDPDQAHRVAVRQERALEIARQLTLEPDTAVPPVGDLEEQLEQDADRLAEAGRAVLATVAVAQRVHAPVLCDDRHVRVLLRRQGVPSFGTMALAIALGEAEVVDAEVVAEARRTLLDAGAVGFRPRGDELARIARAAGWRPTQALWSLANDRWRWFSQPMDALTAAVELLEAVWTEEPDTLAGWLDFVVGAMPEPATGEGSPLGAIEIIATAWGFTTIPPRERGFLQALVDAARRVAATAQVPYQDPAFAALGRWVAAVQRTNVAPWVMLVQFLRNISRLRLGDQLRAMDLFIAS